MSSEEFSYILTVREARNLTGVDIGGKSDPYVVVKTNHTNTKRYKTPKKKKTLNPVWNEKFVLTTPADASFDAYQLILKVYDWDRFSKKELLGTVRLRLQDTNINQGEDASMWLPLRGSRAGKGELHVSIKPLNFSTPVPIEPIIDAEIDEGTVEDFVRELLEGTTFVHVKKKSESKSEFVQLSSDKKELQYGKKKVFIKDVIEVREGQRTRVFLKERKPEAAHLSFSLILPKRRSINFIAPDEDVYRTWVHALRFLVDQQHDHWEDAEYEYAHHMWASVKKESLSPKGIQKLFQKLNVKVSMDYVKQMLQQVDANNDGRLSFDEFIQLLRILRQREEFRSLFERYASDGQHLTAKDLHRFLREMQEDTSTTIGECREIVKRFRERTPEEKEMREEKGYDSHDEEENDTDNHGAKVIDRHKGDADEEASELLLDEHGFYEFLSSELNSAFDPAKAVVYQDMTRPLTDYYIASSHNTFLSGNQLRSSSTAEMYISVLKAGCRCVELDCWNGGDGHPVIYHGHTLTSKVHFEDVVRAINDYAFVTSPYPVILSLENHCNHAQQQVMAKVLTDVFGDKLAKPLPDDHGFDRLPSPEELKHKILLKGSTVVVPREAPEMHIVEEKAEAKKNQRKETIEPLDDTDEQSLSETDEEEEVEEEEDEAETEDSISEGEMEEEEQEPGEQDEPTEVAQANERGDLDEQRASKGETQPGKAAKKKKSKKSRLFGLAKKGAKKSATSIKGKGKQKGRNKKDRPKKQKVHPDLSCIIFCKARRFKDFASYSEHCKCDNMASFVEARALKLVAGAASDWVLHNMKHFSRIYPAGTRFSSSNYDPVPLWNCGCQMVALNYQKPGFSMFVNTGKFLENGQSGYVLKPPCLWDGAGAFDPLQVTAPFPTSKVRKLTVKVISARQLPKVGKQENVTDPYIKLAVVGVPADQRNYKTKVCSNNGFDPQWDESFEFKLFMSELAILVIEVVDKNDFASNKRVAHYAIPVECVRPGYRIIRLLDVHNDPIPMCNLLCKFAIA